MNNENIDKVIRAIKSEPLKFRMTGWDNQEITETPVCGTAACIGGWAEMLADKEGAFPEYMASPQDRAALWLGIGYAQRSELFMMDGNRQREAFDRFSPEIRAKVAVDVLEKLKATGDIDWDEALEANGAHEATSLYVSEHYDDDYDDDYYD